VVHIIVPIYKEMPSEDDLVSIHQLFKILGSHKITFIHPNNLNLKNYHHFPAFFKGFEDSYFESIFGYNQLMLSLDFYQNFSEKYLLIYQTDCFVFKDDLLNWCEKDFDYIGAPWIRSWEKIPSIKLFSDRGIATIKRIFNFRGNGATQKNKSLLYNEVGNGGLSLRKREKFIEVLEQLPKVVEVYLNPKNSGDFYAEDVFFSIEPKRNNIKFTKPNYKIAAKFAIENKQQKALKIIGEDLPFGCHRWNKEKTFWKPYFLKFGYSI
jgi:hypothetical protein